MDSADKYDNSLSLVVRLPTCVILSFRISILFARTLTRFSHLKGRFGTAWQNQQKEFDHLPAPILYTTNCLMPPKNSYADRVFTTEVVAFPGAVVEAVKSGALRHFFLVAGCDGAKPGRN